MSADTSDLGARLLEEIPPDSSSLYNLEAPEDPEPYAPPGSVSLESYSDLRQADDPDEAKHAAVETTSATSIIPQYMKVDNINDFSTLVMRNETITPEDIATNSQLIFDGFRLKGEEGDIGVHDFIKLYELNKAERDRLRASFDTAFENKKKVGSQSGWRILTGILLNVLPTYVFASAAAAKWAPTSEQEIDDTSRAMLAVCAVIMESVSYFPHRYFSQKSKNASNEAANSEVRLKYYEKDFKKLTALHKIAVNLLPDLRDGSENVSSAQPTTVPDVAINVAAPDEAPKDEATQKRRSSSIRRPST